MDFFVREGDEISALISRHLGSNGSLGEELVEFGRLSGDKRKAVEERLRVIDRYLTKPKRPKAQEAEAAAAELGTSVRQFKHLIVKMREFGPVRGLAPHLTRNRQTAVARQGLMPEVEEVLAAQFASDPQVKLARVSAAIASHCEKLGLAAPTQYSLRQRFLELRAEGRFATRAPFGQVFAFDQVKIDLARSFQDLDGQIVTSLPTLTLLIDVGTRIIAGFALLGHLFDDVPIVSSLAYFGGPVQQLLSGTDLPIAKRVEKLTWVVPPDLEEVVEEAKGRVLGKSPIDVAIRTTGPRRHGTEIMKYLGDRLGPYQLFAKQPFGVRAPRSASEGVSSDRAEELIGYCVAKWNNSRLRDLGAQPSFPTNVRHRQVETIIGEVGDIFHPVIDAVTRRNDQQYRAMLS
jgi:hypothetical protein